MREEVHRQANQLARNLSLVISKEGATTAHAAPASRQQQQQQQQLPVGLDGAGGARMSTVRARGITNSMDSGSASGMTDSPMFAYTPPSGSPLSRPGTPSTSAASPGAARPLGNRASLAYTASTPTSRAGSPLVMSPMSPLAGSPMSSASPGVRHVRNSSNSSSSRGGYSPHRHHHLDYGQADGVIPRSQSISPLFRPVNDGSQTLPFRCVYACVRVCC